MKELEKLKKRLPPGIDLRITSKNVVKFRARFRRLGYRDVTKTFPDYKLAIRWLADQETNALNDDFQPARGKKYTFSEALKRYKNEELPKKGNDARNRDHHLSFFEKHLGKLLISRIRPSDIKDALILLESEGTAKRKNPAPATIVRYLASLSHLFTIAWREWEWVSENPVKKIKKPSVFNERHRYLSLDEKERLLSETKKSKCPVLHLIVVLALSTGMRLGEILNLTFRDVNLNEGFIHLKKSKNGKPRFIPLKGYAFRLIAGYMEQQPNHQQDALVLASPTNPNKPYDIRTAWRTALKRANIENFRLHDLRHTTASYHRMNGKGLDDIGLLLGHTDTRSTSRYAHVSNEYKSQMVEELDQELFGGINVEKEFI